MTGGLPLALLGGRALTRVRVRVKVQVRPGAGVEEIHKIEAPSDSLVLPSLVLSQDAETKGVYH